MNVDMHLLHELPGIVLYAHVHVNNVAKFILLKKLLRINQQIKFIRHRMQWGVY